MGTKTYKVGFYCFGVSNDFEGTIVDVLDEWVASTYCPVIDQSAVKYELRGLSKTGHVYRGYIGKLRCDDLPLASSPRGNERPLDLADDEGLLEKNYFLYLSRQRVLVYQHHGNGTTAMQFGRYLTQSVSSTISVDPVIQPEALKRLMRGRVHPKMVDISIARPAASFVPDTDFSRGVINLLDSSEGKRIRLKITLGQSKGPLESLAHSVKEGVSELLDTGKVSVAKLHVSEDGDAHPIDLISDRIRGEAVVNLESRYPEEEEIYRALKRCWDSHKAVIEESIGTGGNALV